MIPPIIAVQTSNPVASIQQNTEGQAVLMNQNANTKVQEEQRQLRETVINKEDAVFYEQHYDAKDEGKNKYFNLYSKKKKGKDEKVEEDSSPVNRVNFDIKI